MVEINKIPELQTEVKQGIIPIGFIERLIQETNDLKEKLTSLNNFIGSTTYNELDAMDKEDLLEQNLIMKELQSVLIKRLNKNLIKYSYPSTADLPNTCKWKDTNWDLELKRAIKEGYSYITTPEGYYYRINSEDSVTDVPLMVITYSNETTTKLEDVKINTLSSQTITPEYIENLIKKEKYHIVSDRLTICVLTLENNFEVTGESSCLTPENFNKEMGEKVSRNNAKQKIWQFEGYLLKQRDYERSGEL